MICVFVYVCMRSEKEIVFVYGNYKDSFVWIPATDVRGHPKKNCGIYASSPPDVTSPALASKL